MATIQLRRATAAEWAAANPILRAGEPGWDSTNGVLKVGDGTTVWASLTGISGGGGLTQEELEDFVGAMVTGNTETGITVTYDDGTGKLNFVTAVTSAYTDEMARDAINAAFAAGTQTGVTVTTSDPSDSISLSVPPRETAVFRSGTLTVAAGTKRVYNDSGQTRTLIKVGQMVDTAPTGAALIGDVNKNGTTIFTTQGNRPSIAASGLHAVSGTPDVTAWADGDYLTFDVDQVGSTIAGADIAWIVYWR
jgi:hypothetical protein